MQESYTAQLTGIYHDLRIDFCDFFRVHPAFEVSLFIIFGIFFHTSLSIFALALSLFFSYFLKKPFKGTVIFLLSSCFYFVSLPSCIHENKEWKNAKGYITVTKKDFVKKNGIKCSGILKAIDDNTAIRVEKPISLFLPKSYENTLFGDFIIL